MGVHEAGGHDFVGGVDLLASLGAGEPAHGADAVALDADVGPEPGIATAVHDPAARDEEIEHKPSNLFSEGQVAG